MAFKVAKVEQDRFSNFLQLATRIKIYRSNIINSDQTGYVKIYISEKIS